MPYIGNQFNSNFSSLAKQTLTGNGGANYTLTTPIANANEIEVFVNNVRQDPGVAYNVNGTALTMTCLLYTSPSPRDRTRSRMPSSA